MSAAVVLSGFIYTLPAGGQFVNYHIVSVVLAVHLFVSHGNFRIVSL